jgi:hypothetical protein
MVANASGLGFARAASGTLTLHFAFVFLLAAGTGGSSRDLANRFLWIELRTGARIGVAVVAVALWATPHRAC